MSTKKVKKIKKKNKASRKPIVRDFELQAEQAIAVLETLPEQTLVPYDENLLERSRTQWQFGDWESLVKLNRDTLQHHPDRAKLALLAAAGRLQTGNDNNVEARQFIRLAQDWGLGKKLISQILIAGVHNSLGRVAATSNQQQRAFQHFESAITIGTPEADVRLLLQVRSNEQLSQFDQTVPLGNSVNSVDKVLSRATLEKEKLALGLQGNTNSEFAEIQVNLKALEELTALQGRQLFAFEELIARDARPMLVSQLLSCKKFRHLFLDCGAHDGCSAIKFLLMYPDFDVVSFEPNPVLWDYHADLPTCLSRSAVGVDDGVASLLVDSLDADGSSLLPDKQIDNTGNWSNDELPLLTVSSISLPELIRTLRPHYDRIVVKLDVEGMEYPILERMRADGMLSMIDELYCEFHWMKMGYPEHQHTDLVKAIRQVVDLHNWDALEFSVHGRKSGTLRKIRDTLIQSVITTRSQIRREK